MMWMQNMFMRRQVGRQIYDICVVEPNKAADRRRDTLDVSKDNKQIVCEDNAPS